MNALQAFSDKLDAIKRDMKAIIEIKDVAFREIGDINRGRGKPIRDCVKVFESYKVITFFGIPIKRITHRLNDWDPEESTSNSHKQE